MYTHLAYADFDDIVHYLADGWVISNSLEDCHHGHYGVLMCIKSEREEIDYPSKVREKKNSLKQYKE